MVGAAKSWIAEQISVKIVSKALCPAVYCIENRIFAKRKTGKLYQINGKEI